MQEEVDPFARRIRDLIETRRRRVRRYPLTSVKRLCVEAEIEGLNVALELFNTIKQEETR